MEDPNIPDPIRVNARGAARWAAGHPWIYRSDTIDPAPRPGIARVTNQRGKFLGQALCSPASEITLRLLEPGDRPVNRQWWREKLAEAEQRRLGIAATGWRVVHGEGDGLPSLIVDRYDRWIVAQLLSAGLESMREWILEGIQEVLSPAGILLRNDVAVRRHEQLPETVDLVAGSVPESIEIREGDVRYLAAPWTGQKTGAFLDQRPNRLRIAGLTQPGGRALDCFAYHGSFALHLATRAGAVLALDVSQEALARGQANAALNQLSNITWQAGDVFEELRQLDRSRTRFNTIVLDPPAFAKSRDAVPAALKGYHEINRRAMRLLEPGGVLLTASCSYHVRRPDFERMLASAAADSGRRIALVEWIGQGIDHPEILTIPETSYLKGAILRAA
jgi:23S rRNA (cytosine1962-C5)-methyltransferase